MYIRVVRGLLVSCLFFTAQLAYISRIIVKRAIKGKIYNPNLVSLPINLAVCALTFGDISSNLARSFSEMAVRELRAVIFNSFISARTTIRGTISKTKMIPDIRQSGIHHLEKDFQARA
jgi:hypothetical protein